MNLWYDLNKFIPEVSDYIWIFKLNNYGKEI